jgi:hypothetical protein
LVVCEKVLKLPAQLGIAGTFAVEVSDPARGGKLACNIKHFRKLVGSFGVHAASAVESMKWS